MIAYIVRRLLLIPPTLFGILLLNFTIVQFAPGGPVEQVISRLQSDTEGPIAAPRGSTPNWSRKSKNSSASTSRRWSGSN
jgi:microcin C transport system permease protein